MSETATTVRLWKVETTAQIRRIYFVEADSPEAAEDRVCEEGPAVTLVTEEDLTEDIDDVSEVKNGDALLRARSEDRS